MAQQRIYNFLADIDYSLDNMARYTIAAKGVYRGFELSPSASGGVQLATGYGVQHNGIVWAENTSREIYNTAITPGAPTNYTVYASHTDVSIGGGAAVTYTVQSGTLLSAITGAVILGWIRHPGGGVPLAASHIQNAPKRLITEYVSSVANTLPSTLIAPLQDTYSDVAAKGPNVTFLGQTAADVQFDGANYVVYQSVAKAGGAPGAETLIQHIQFYATNWPPSSIELYVDVGSGASLAVQLRDTALNPVTITGSPITSTGGWAIKTISVELGSGVFVPGYPYELRLTHSVDSGQTIKLSRVAVKYWPYPE